MSKTILDQVKLLIPPLTSSLHKGQAGRIGVFGGSRDYTGAPYYSAMAALKTGADLAHIVCSPDAAPAIKTYSPDLMVYPFLTHDASVPELTGSLSALLPRLHVLVVGPGLGREEHMQNMARLAIRLAREKGLYLVLDADALLLVGQDPELVKGYRKCVITPNINEFSRLCDSLNLPTPSPNSGITKSQAATTLSNALGGVTVLQKGETDIISIAHSTGTSGERETAEVVTRGGLKRCGGQGDILTGIVATMLAWTKGYEEGVYNPPNSFTPPVLNTTRLPLLASVGAAILTRTISRRAFEKHGRATMTTDMIPEIQGAFADVFEGGSEGQRKVSALGVSTGHNGK